MNSDNLLILGGGIVGLTAAVAMAERGFSVQIFDKASIQDSLEQPFSRVYALNHASIHLLKHLKIWPFISSDLMVPYTNMLIWDTQNQASMHFSGQDIAKHELGVMIQEHLLKKALLQRIADLPIVLHAEMQIETIIEQPNSITINTPDQVFTGTFLIGCDGGQSDVRKMLNIPINTWSYDQASIVAAVHTEKPHQRTAYQAFTVQGPLAFLPLPNDHQCSIVWSVDTSYAHQLMHLEAAAFNQAHTHLFDRQLGSCELISKRITFPLVMRHTQQYHGARWMLMGDAAHTMHPLAGLGLNVGLADLHNWLQLTEHKTTLEDCIQPQILGAYQRARKYDVWQTILLLQTIKTCFQTTNSLFNSMRKAGLTFINHSQLLKKMIIQYANQ